MNHEKNWEVFLIRVLAVLLGTTAMIYSLLNSGTFFPIGLTLLIYALTLYCAAQWRSNFFRVARSSDSDGKQMGEITAIRCNLLLSTPPISATLAFYFMAGLTAMAKPEWLRFLPLGFVGVFCYWAITESIRVVKDLVACKHSITFGSMLSLSASWFLLLTALIASFRFCKAVGALVLG